MSFLVHLVAETEEVRLGTDVVRLDGRPRLDRLEAHELEGLDGAVVVLVTAIGASDHLRHGEMLLGVIEQRDKALLARVERNADVELLADLNRAP